MIKDFNELLKKARERDKKRLVVAVAGEERVLESVGLAEEEGLVEPILIGDEDKIRRLAEKVGLKKDKYIVINEKDKSVACSRAVRMVSQGDGDILMKGLVDTSIIMKAVLNKDYGLRTGHLISHIAMIEAKNLNRLVFITDGGMNIKPDLDEKRQIIINAVKAARKLGYNRPKVAVLAAIEKVNPDMPETMDAAALSKMGERGQIEFCIIDGPLAIDNAISSEAARIKGIESPVAGEADILLVPEIIAGNILGKSSIYFAGDRIATIIGGTSSPVVLTSRASSSEIKLVSIAATVLMAD